MDFCWRRGGVDLFVAGAVGVGWDGVGGRGGGGAGCGAVILFDVAFAAGSCGLGNRGLPEVSEDRRRRRWRRQRGQGGDIRERVWRARSWAVVRSTGGRCRLVWAIDGVGSVFLFRGGRGRGGGEVAWRGGAVMAARRRGLGSV